MMSKRYKLVILIILGFLVPLSISKNMNLIDNHKSIKIDPKSSGGYNLSFIHIDDSNPKNWSWTAGNYSWCYFKNGIYFIENVTIDASDSPTGNGILINNSVNEYFIIRNCTIFNADHSFFDSGIWLENTNNGTIINNTISGNKQGIYLIDSDGNKIIENTLKDNEWNGLYFDTNCEYNNITGNVINNNNDGIQLETDCNYNNITLNIVNNNNQYGIFINSFQGGSDNNIILNNTANENNVNGIYIRYNNNENSVINNTANNNGGIGICLDTCHYINVTGNSINNNKRGIYLQDCDNSNIIGNTINNNLEIGIYLYYNSDSNEIKNNTINKSDLGIRLDYNSNYNNITGNSLEDNNWCIYETYCEGNIIEYNDCSSPTVELPIFINDYATGVGAHNWTWAKSQPWCSGTGTSLDPYIIENLIISGFGTEKYGIDIRNSNVSFIIQECLIYNSDEAGIYFDNVNNSRLINNNCSNNDNGIYVEYSNSITIYENTANDNNIDGIYGYAINYVNITGNTANNNDEGIYINICNFSYIIDNIVNGNTEEGIYLEECYNNTLSGNSANDNDQGIVLWYFCYNNTISGNIANGNCDGIHLEDSDYNCIIENIANNNDRAGIYLSRSDHNYISENSANDNIYNGIFLEDECYNNIILGNYFNGNQEGMYLYYSDFNDVIGNTANNNDELGIGLEGSNNNTISGNTVDNSKNTGVYIQDDSNENFIIGNIIYNNTQGIFFESNCGSNSVYKNFFLKNGKHAVDDGSDNKWNDTIIGNYWDNHTGPDVSPQDGIVDNPYTYIGGSAGSIDYLPIAEDGAPRIIINSPLEGERFGNTAPNFNIEVTDIYVYEMWYTLDGGLNNYTFTENGTINQAAWDVLPEGSVTITFFARDIVGNEAFEEVIIIKGIPSGGLDPTVIIIIVVSIVGGIAIIGVILGILLKKGKISLEKLKNFSFKRK